MEKELNNGSQYDHAAAPTANSASYAAVWSRRHGFAAWSDEINRPCSPSTSLPPALPIEADAPDLLPAGTARAVDPAPLLRHSIVDINAMVKALCQHTMKASEISRLVETEIRQLRADNAALRRELSASGDQGVAPFDRPYESEHSSPESVSALEVDSPPLARDEGGTSGKFSTRSKVLFQRDPSRLAHVKGGPSGKFSTQSKVSFLRGPPRLAHVEGGHSLRLSAQSLRSLSEESDVPKDAPQQTRTNSKHSEVSTDQKTITDQVSPKLNLQTSKTLNRIRFNKAQQTFILEKQKTIVGDVLGHRKTAIKGHLLFDPERIKTKLREAIVKPVYDVTKFYHKAGYAQAIARSSLFENTTLLIIMLNAVWIAVDTQHNRSDLLLDADPVYQVAEQMFCTYFFVEWLIRFMAFKQKRDCKNDAWFVFDSVLLVSMVTETWIMTVILLIMRSGSGGSALGVIRNASLVRMLRLLRITRLARAVKLLRFAPEVLVMLKAVLSSLRCVLWTFVLLLCVVFFFGVGFTQLCRGSALEQTYFTSLTMSMHTLLIGSVFPDLVEMSKEILDEHILYWFLWMTFMLFAGLAILNLLVGVLVEIVKNSSNLERDAMDVSYTRQTFMNCLGLEKEFQEDADHIDTLTISKEEFADLIEDDAFIVILMNVGIDIIGLVDLVDWIFMSGDMKFAELLEIILQLRSSAHVTVRDIVDLRKFLTFEIHKMQADLYFMTQQIPPDASQSLFLENADTQLC